MACMSPRSATLTPLPQIINRDSGKYTFAVSAYMLELYQVCCCLTLSDSGFMTGSSTGVLVFAYLASSD
jgi:hypothetical protein